MKLSAFRLFLTILAGFFPYIRKIPIQENKNFNYAVEVIDRVSKKLVDDKYKNIKSDGKDLLSILININKTLPVEEKLSDDELKYQVIKKKRLYCIDCIGQNYHYLFCILFVLGYDIFIGRTCNHKCFTLLGFT